jgi:hypothetical protein
MPTHYCTSRSPRSPSRDQGDRRAIAPFAPAARTFARLRTARALKCVVGSEGLDMARYSTMIFVGLLGALMACSSNGGGSGGSSETRTITGSVPASGATTTKDYGGVGVTNGGAGVHVAAYRLHAKDSRGSRADVVVGSDGRFRVDVDRGARYVINVETDGGQSAALVTFGGSRGVLDVGVSGEGDIEVGALKVTGGLAKSSATIASGATAAVAAADEYFDAADGALTAARDAVDAAIKATQAACTAAQQSLAAAQAACKSAGAACGSTVDQAQAQTNDECAAANDALNGAAP